MIYYRKEVIYKMTTREKVRRTSIMKNEQYKEAVNSLVRHIQDADAIVVGGASGMSAAAGFRHYYEHDKDFIDNLGEFEKKYGYRNSFDGFYYRYRTSEERWAFIARNLCMILDAETGQPYYDLNEILKDKNYYILTTNQDTQCNVPIYEESCPLCGEKGKYIATDIRPVFPEEKISAIQGDGDSFSVAEDVMMSFTARWTHCKN